MKIGILSRNGKLYSTRRLVEAAIERGHEVEVVDPIKCYMSISSTKPVVYYQDRALNDFEALIPRIGASITFYGTAVLRQFETRKTFSLNDSQSISRARDKLRCLQILAKKGIGLPTSGFAHSTKETDKLIQMVGGVPLIVKLLEGTQGKGVVLAQDRGAAESVIDSFRGMKAHFLVQQFIREANGSDIRCFVIGDKVVGSMIRTAREGEFRSNLHCGGTAQSVKITPDERKVAIAATKAVGLKVAGVDILRSSQGPLVLEVNSSPGLEGIERATKKDIAAKIIQYIEEYGPKGNSDFKGHG